MISDSKKSVLYEIIKVVILKKHLMIDILPGMVEYTIKKSAYIGIL